MAFAHGSKARVYLNSKDVSSWVRSVGMTLTQDVAESTVLTDTAKTYGIGQSTRTHTMDGLYDKDMTTVRDSLGVEAGELTYCPGGASAIGDLAWMSSIIGTSYEESIPIADMVPWAWEGQPSGPTAYGFLLHPLAEDTNTTTGASRDGGAATTTGWTAHLHVTAVDAGSWVIKLQDSADSSSWADVTGGAFTAATGATSERLASVTGATLRRYVRYLATRTGGSAGDGVTFLLGLARSYVP